MLVLISQKRRIRSLTLTLYNIYCTSMNTVTAIIREVSKATYKKIIGHFMMFFGLDLDLRCFLLT